MVLHAGRDETVPIRCSDLEGNGSNVPGDGVLTDIEGVGDLLIGQSLANELDHIEFAKGNDTPAVFRTEIRPAFKSTVTGCQIHDGLGRQLECQFYNSATALPRVSPVPKGGRTIRRKVKG